MFYIETGSLDPCYNLAFEEYILTRKTAGDWLMLWQNANTVVVGLYQNTLEEIDPDFVKTHGVTVVRRATGGGAVYHDLGNLNYSFITDAKDQETVTPERFLEPVCAALRAMGADAAVTGRNDITIRGKKVSGAAQRLHGGRILHHGTLLFASDPAMIAGALRARPDKFQSKSVKSVRARVGNIRDFLPGSAAEDAPGSTPGDASDAFSIEDFKSRLLAILAGDGAARPRLDEGELSEIRILADQKYRTWEWNFGHSPPFSLQNSRRFPGGALDTRMDLRNGRIAAIEFFGDFLGRLPLDGIKQALTGCRYERGAVSSVLDAFPLADLFGGVTRSDLLQTMFDSPAMFDSPKPPAAKLP
ncbi:MAG: lipoate--protein ligase [Peptococcaceae bacterium]|nr:lipoate--protein ligase [Peptococcaceae bacterium]